MSLARTALLPLLAILVGAAPAAAAPPREQRQLDALRERIEALQRELATAESSRSEAADALRESERAISEANRSLRDLSAEARQLQSRLRELREQSTETDAALAAQRKLLGRMLYQQYTAGSNPPLRLLLNREDPNRIARQLHYLSVISGARARAISDLRSSLDRLRDLERATEQAADELDNNLSEQKSVRARLEHEKAARAATLAKISHTVREQRREIGTLRRDENRLARLVENLSRVIARTPRPAPPRTRNETVPQRTDDEGPFATLKGRLRLPVRGEIAGRFGAQRAAGGATWKGLFIAARAGETVRAVASGRVVFADWLRGFGNLLIIDHGDAYMSLYGNNESLFRQVGDAIRVGDTVASVGSTGGNADSGLYFELRYQGKPLDPLAWVASD